MPIVMQGYNMRRKHKTYLLVLFFAPLVFGIPTLLNSHFPKQLMYYTKITYLFPIIAACLCIFAFLKKSKRSNISKSIRKNITLSNALDPLKIAGIILLLLCGLIGQAGMFIQHAVGQGHIDTLAKSKYMIDAFHQLSWKTALWPWALVGVTTVSFTVRSKTSAMQPFSEWLPSFGMPSIMKTIRKGIDTYIEMSTRLFVCLALGIFLASLCLVVGHMSVRPMVGTLSFFFLLLMIYSKRFKTLENNIMSFNISPTAIFSCMLVFMFFIAMAVKLMIIILLNHTGSARPLLLTSHATPLILHKQSWLMSWHLWFWSWWIIATPLAASCIAKFTQTKKAHLTLVWTLLFGAIIATLLQCSAGYIHLYLAEKLLNPTLSLFLQSLSILGLFALFSTLGSHHIIWMGFVPRKTPKKLRVMKLRIMWALIAMVFGTMLLSGLQSILLIQMLIAIASVLILLLSVPKLIFLH